MQNNEKWASAFIWDTRGSTKLLNRNDLYHEEYFAFLSMLKAFAAKLSLNSVPQSAFNDTGDGFVMVFWSDKHATEALNYSTLFYDQLNVRRESLTKDVGTRINYGFGLHSGECFVYENPDIHRTFVYGKLLNSTARLESFTKNFVRCEFLMTDQFIEELKRQTLGREENVVNSEEFDRLRETHLPAITSMRVNIHDESEDGHILYTIKDINVSEFNKKIVGLRNWSEG